MENKRNKMFFMVAVALFASISLLWSLHSLQAGQQDNNKENIKLNTPSNFKLSDAQILRSEIAVETVSERTIRTVLNVPGEISFKPDKAAHIVSQVSGVVKDVKVDEGDTVKAGDVLVVLESRELANAKVRCITAKEKEGVSINLY